MTQHLKENHAKFIALMLQDEERAQWGYELLLKRDEFDEFFTPLKDAGLFNSEHNPKPKPADKEGGVYIPFWHATEYLKAVALKAAEENNHDRARELLSVLRDATEHGTPDNYHTFRAFAEILGLVPINSISTEDLGMILIWISGKYDDDMIAHSLKGGLLPRLLSSPDSCNWDKALVILDYCLTIKWITKKTVDSETNEKFTSYTPRALIDGSSLEELVEANISEFCRQAADKAAQIIFKHTLDVFNSEKRSGLSFYWRPAIEEHEQNRTWKHLENTLVSALRDSAIAWIESKPNEAKLFVGQLLAHKADIARRVGIYLLNKKWNELQTLLPAALKNDLLQYAHIHESYHLLQDRFSQFPDGDKTAVLDEIKKLEPSSERPGATQYLQRNWLSAIKEKGSDEADEWWRELSGNNALGTLSDHPDFYTYHYPVQSGFGPSPYSVDELIATTKEGAVVKILNAFKESGGWQEPSVESLVQTVTAAVVAAPELFIDILPNFLTANLPYQHAVLRGFEQLRRDPQDAMHKLNWDNAWSVLIKFMDDLINVPNFWKEEAIESRGLQVTKDWIPPIIATLLTSATQKNEQAAPKELLPKMLKLTTTLLDNLESKPKDYDDAMTYAINAPRGKALEALFNHALRECRIAGQDHSAAWKQFEPIFDKELKKCEGDNFEFSTLAGSYIPQLDYLSHEWLKRSLPKVFNEAYPDNFACALDGLAFASASKPVFKLLKETGVLDIIVRTDKGTDQARARLMERLALAYLWGDEAIDSGNFKHIFTLDHVGDLKEMSDFLGRAHSDQLEEDQVERVFVFWEKSTEIIGDAIKEPTEAISLLLASLSKLSCYVKGIDERLFPLLEAVAPFAHTSYNTNTFIKALTNMVEVTPQKVLLLLNALLTNYKPNYDHKRNLEYLVNRLFVLDCQTEAIKVANQLRHLPRFIRLYEKFNQGE